MKDDTRAKRVFTLLLSATLICTSGLSAACTATTSGTGTTQAITSTTSSVATEETVVDIEGMDSEYTDADLDGTWDDSTATHITLADNAITIDGEGASAEGSTLTISAGGTYVLSGTLSDGQVVVAAGTEDKLKVVLNAVSVNCETGPAILVSEADKVFITLAEGTQSYLSDGASYMLAEGEDEPNAVLFSKVDLTLNGTGELEIESSYRHAICSKDDLVITGGSYVIDAAEDALRGRDCVKICAGTFEIEAGGDAIKSNNDEDSTLGSVSVDGGTFDITAGDDGIQAETLLRVTGGDLVIDAENDALHSSYEVRIQDGTLAITAVDDAIHAEESVIINGGTIDIDSSTEGIEGAAVTISSGTISLYASDDGINATGSASNNATITILDGTIDIEVGSGDTDAIDANGSVYIKGGTITLTAPTSSIDYDDEAEFTGGTLIINGDEVDEIPAPQMGGGGGGGMMGPTHNVRP